MYTHIEGTTTRRTIALVAVTALLFVGLSAAPALADKPTEDSFSVTFPSVNPCTGLGHEVTLNLEFRDHLGHDGNFVGHLSRTGSTDDGYVMNHGVDNFVFNGNVIRAAFTDQWRHADGSKFKVHGVFVLDLSAGEVLVDRFSLTCIGN